MEPPPYVFPKSGENECRKGKNCQPNLQIVGKDKKGGAKFFATLGCLVYSDCHITLPALFARRILRTWGNINQEYTEPKSLRA